MAFRLPKLTLPKRHRSAGAHRPAPGRPHPTVKPGGASRGITAQKRSEDTGRYRGEHRGRGVHRETRALPRVKDPFEAPRRPNAPLRTPRPVMGQPERSVGRPGRPRARFGDEPIRVTDMASAYRAEGRPARTPAEQRRAQEHTAAEEKRWRERAEAKRRADLVQRVTEHEPHSRRTIDRSKGTTTAARSGTGSSEPGRHRKPEPRKAPATGRAERPASAIPPRKNRTAQDKAQEQAGRHYRADRKAGKQIPGMAQDPKVGGGGHWYFDDRRGHHNDAT